MPKMLFLSPETCRAMMGTAERGPSLLRRGNSGWIEWKMRVACVALALFPQQRDRKWPGTLGGHRPSSVCLYQTATRHFK